jgi:serine/threonine protein phosphatase PrpC
MGPVQDAARVVRDSPRVSRDLRAAAGSDPGSQREVNEDRLHCDLSRGIFAVIDGVGGQAAGGRAADIALMSIRTRLERETGTVIDRVTEAITIANNEVLRAGVSRPEWRGMACVLTIVVVEDGRAIVGHVGDTRLYKVTGGGITKITRDHSPVGEREDAQQLSELEAMRHPRRNEVYRDVGSEEHDPSDLDFIDIYETSFEPDAALLLCSDGLTDAVASPRIRQTVAELAGQPERVVDALIDAANAAGGKDNITVVYVEGERFAEARRSTVPAKPRRRAPVGLISALIVAAVVLVAAFAALRLRSDWRASLTRLLPRVLVERSILVRASESIAEALQSAGPGSTVIVEPGEYHERLLLRTGVRLISRVPRAAIIRLPGEASETDPAVVATGIQDAEFAGFRILGDAASALGTGVLARNADLSIVDVEVSGATAVAIDVGGVSRPSVVASDIHDNPGAALAIRAGAEARIVHNVFMRNGLSTAAAETLVVEAGARPLLSGNVFHGAGRNAPGSTGDPWRPAFLRDNWFPRP